MRQLAISVFLVLAFLGFLPAASAYGVIPGLTDTSDFDDSGSDWYSMNWDYVYRTRAGTSVAISPFHLITAKHYTIVVGNTFTIDGDEFEVVDTTSPPADSGQTLMPDLRILTLENNTHPGVGLPGYYQLYTGGFTSGQDILMVGTGKTGTDHTTYYMENAGSARMKRWGTNEYVSSIRKLIDSLDADSDPDWSTYCIRMNHNSSDTEYEAGYGDGDSGGGVFVEEDGIWKLAAIHLYRETGGIEGRYNKSFAAPIPYYADWITETIPEPATVLLLLAGGTVLTTRRRKV